MPVEPWHHCSLSLGWGLGCPKLSVTRCLAAKTFLGGILPQCTFSVFSLTLQFPSRMRIGRCISLKACRLPTAWLRPNTALYNLSFFPVSQPGEELFPKDEHGELIFDTVDLCATWEVSTAPNSYVSDLGERGRTGDSGNVDLVQLRPQVDSGESPDVPLPPFHISRI